MSSTAVLCWAATSEASRCRLKVSLARDCWSLALDRTGEVGGGGVGAFGEVIVVGLPVGEGVVPGVVAGEG